MRSEGKIYSSYNEAIVFLKDVGIYKSENLSRKFTLDNSKYPSDFFEKSQSLKYSDLYKYSLEHSIYDILLDDDAYFQFSFTKNRDGSIKYIRYAYYPNPCSLSIDQFIKEFCFSEEDNSLVSQLYDQYCYETTANNEISPIRYEFNPDQHNPNIHAVSHLHIGFSENMRLSSSIVLTPLKFSVFVIRNTRYHEWKRYYTSADEKKREYLLNIKSNCLLVESINFNQDEKNLIFLS